MLIIRAVSLSGVAAVLLITAAAFAGSTASSNPSEGAAVATSSSAARRTARYEIPDLTMFDQHGRAVSLPELFASERPVMVNFIFTHCSTICPMTTAIFQQVQNRLGDESGDVVMVSVSIDPEHDTPDVLAEYAARFGAGPQWRFLTGSLEASVAVQQAFGTHKGDKMFHAPVTLLRANANSAWIRLDGFASASDLLAEYRAMLQAAQIAAGKDTNGSNNNRNSG